MQQFAQINQLFWNGSWFEYFFYASILLILIFEKRKTHKLVFGVFPAVMIVGMFNPLTSAAVSVFFDSANLYYVRLFSIIPVFYCLAHSVTLILSKTRGIVKLVGVCIAVAALLIAGRCVYREDWMRRSENLEKVPSEVFEVLDAIPREREYVRVALPDPLYVYARQVDGTVVMPYGRQISSAPVQLRDELNQPVPDALSVMKMSGNQGLDYVVVKKSDEVKAAFSDSGHEPVGETPGYYVYPVTGVPKLELTLNDRRQVGSKTFIDSEGNPVYSDISVITTFVYEYDRWGNRTGEAYYDKDYNRVTVTDGYSGVKKTCKRIGLSWATDSIMYLDTLDQPLLAFGRYETRYDYNRNKQIARESYYDLDGQPMNRLDTGYAAVSKRYDEFGRVIAELYTDVTGHAVTANAGYAAFTRRYDVYNRIISERYYDTSGAVADNSDGFAVWNRAYDDYGNVVEEVFFDEQGNRVDIKGRIKQDLSSDLLQRAARNSVANSVGIGYRWNDDGSCTVSGTSQGISWNSLLEGDRPFYLLNGETYRVQYSSENVYLRIYFYSDSTWNTRIDELATKGDAEFTVPWNCGGVIIRLWVAPGTSVNETVRPRIFAM